MFEDGRLKPRVTSLPLEDFRDAYGLLAGREVIGKVGLTM